MTLRIASRVMRSAFFLCALSAALLILSFPNFNIFPCAWVALVPFFFAVRQERPAQTFLLGCLTGLLFYGGAMYWLVHVTLLGTVLLCAYLALYFGVVALFVRSTQYARRITILSIPAMWVALEYLRTNFATGFGWLLLGYSQYQNLPLIQIADVTGPYGVSFLVVMVNVAIYQVINARLVKKSPRPLTPSLVIVFLCVAVTLGYGYFRLNRGITGEPLKISVIQGNIPQEKKWDAQYETYIFDRYEIITKVASVDEPDLIIWPETAFPGYFGYEEDLTQRMKKLVRDVRTPVLFGTPFVKTVHEEPLTANSAILLAKDGSVLNRYDKLHLVPFGEYVPFEKVFGFVHRIAPFPIANFTPGAEYTVFKLPALRHKPGTANQTFGVLICFEDIFPRMVRHFVRRGATFMVNMTNDAWFKETAAPHQHAQASVFRAVENRVPVVRAANTGLSCFIDTYGTIAGTVHDRAGKEIFVEGYETGSVTTHPVKSLYTRYGDVFAWACIIVVLLSLVIPRLPEP